MDPVTHTAASGRLRVSLLKSPTHFGHYTSRVNRPYNEDKYSAGVLELNGVPVFNFNIFDGHGGDECSTFLQDHLAQEIEDVNTLVENQSERDQLIQKYWKNIGGYWKRWYRHRADNFVRMSNGRGEVALQKIDAGDDLGARLPLGFLSCDYKFFETDSKSGSTCTSVYLRTLWADERPFKPVFEDYYFNRRTISKLTIAHVGDTKAILVDKHGEAHALTQEHHPSNPNEASRLRKYAANFFMTDSFGEERFIALANTRAFGDIDFKQMGVTAEPDVINVVIGDYDTVHSRLTKQEIEEYTVGGIGGDESFLVLCSDGVSNEITDQETADIIMNTFNMRGHSTATPQGCAEEVVKFIEYIGGDDNATCLVVRLNGWGKWAVKDRTGELRQQRMEDSFRRGDDR
ncbi:Protein phosphatase 2C 6 [Yamadazyma tenuis]|uniref:Protein serine/threonine phosphatase 2C n=1 Tax=Candida tenuis (strain ATCC 10573 / BCRC 21748 / CBS 615 / JCM 9827 / NBRC 10315 / NRRL Y-1498 / VKM Y-70) TaxID=590646 RepID=G3B3E7_CANTC|nr:protein serine/threonine phosphatase 2C [Yamadazyma tenuis ATCC 10573]EGV64148.1 protein serine/threonine phosphatase 2C [Yamadazyma tenuis ATCC 10573]WEJ96210.1 Protein phosphatase 2C 6 [Yamadazyma tenuis]